MNSMDSFLNRQSKVSLMIMGLVMVAIIGYVDHITGPYYDFFLLYLIPVTLVGWYCGGWLGFIMSFASAMAWFIADDIRDYHHVVWHVVLWNTFIRVAVFGVISYTLWQIRLYHEKTRELTEFIVHDLRSPLAAVTLGLSELGEKGCSTPGTCQTNMLKACRLSAARMTTLVNAILDTSKLESKKLIPLPSEVALAELIDGVLEETSVFAERQSVKLEKQLGCSKDSLYTDHAILVRILVNLISNAVKVSPAGTCVSITAIDEGADRIRFSVIDRGRGIPKAMLGKVFDKFTQLKVSESGLMRGSGLGLTFSKLAVESLGGRIEINSEVGKGTAVSFVLPIRSHIRASN